MQRTMLKKAPIKFNPRLVDIGIAVFDMKGVTYSQVPDHITQVAFVAVGQGSIENGKEKHWFVNPGDDVKIPPLMSYLNFLNEYKIRQADPLELVLPDFGKNLSDRLLATHNIKRFNLPLLNKIRAFTNPGDSSDKDAFYIDTYQIVKKLRPGLKNYTLTTCATEFGVPLHNYLLHNALEDTRVTAQLLVKLLQELNSMEILTVDDLRSFLSKR